MSGNEKIRADQYLVQQGLAQSREKAQAMIMAGMVYQDQQKITKPSFQVKAGTELTVRGEKSRYVSRGALKLEKGLRVFGVSAEGRTAMDVGASTGGFTDVLLQKGAKQVFAIDVGYGQLAWKLRQDERVVNLERTNFRYVTSEQITDPIDFFSVDVSFISLKKILPVARQFLKEDGTAVCLIKPQFEAGRENVGKNGVVRDPKVHEAVITDIIDFVSTNGYSVLGLDFSPVKGPEGNIEYLCLIEKGGDTEETITDAQILSVVRTSHEELT